MRTCFVHIGMHKTGSTAIQAAFHRYDDGKTAMLRLDKPNHTWPMLMLFSAKSAWAAKRSGARIRHLDTHIRSLRARIASQIEASQANIVISGEGLSLALTAGEVATFKAFLSQWFDDIRIIIYLRDPGSYMRSAFQQSAKSTAVRLDLDGFHPCYRARIEPWITGFGHAKIDAVLFERSAFEGGSVIHDFASRIGADVRRVRHSFDNASLRAEGFAMTYALRAAMASGALTAREWVRHRTDLYMTRHFGELGFDFSDTLYAEALAKQTADIAWAEKLLDRPFPERKRDATAVVFGSQDDILRYAAQCRPAFDAWKCRNFGPLRRWSYLARALRHRVTLSRTLAQHERIRTDAP